MQTIITTLHKLLSCSADKVLFEENEKSLTAIELDQLSSSYAGQLLRRGVRAGHNVAVLLPRGIDAAASIYSILKIGACYVPIDAKSPQNRQAFIIRDAQCKCVIGKGNPPQWMTTAATCYVDITESDKLKDTIPAVVPADDQQNCAILYTSGSTGTPKGVVISNRAIMSFCNWSTDTFSIDSNDRIANLTPFHFDLSLFDLFAGPLAGARTIFMPDSLTMAPAKLIDWLIEKAITCWYTVPSILGFLLYKGNLANKSATQLKQILFAGEVFSTAKLIEFTSLLPTTKFYNLFGPTETNVCLYWPVDRQQLKADQAIPIGVPASQAELKICPENQQLLVKGPCLMNGYWKNGKLELPLDDQHWYHTGDKVSINALGEYCYHGRLDRMIKSAGYRIEPAEIEQTLNSVSGVEDAAVLATDDSITGSVIVAAVVAPSIDRLVIKKQVREKLPPYMQPGRYFFIDVMPTLSNGKIDYRSIRTMIEAGQNQ